MKPCIALFSLLTTACAATFCQAQNSRVPTAPLHGGTLLQADFESRNGWLGITPAVVGTIDIAGSTQPSRGLRSNALISSGPLAIRNTESNLGKLTLAFSLSASAARPVRVLVESFNARRQRTGGLETLIHPAAPDFYQRYALDLSDFKLAGAGKFVPNAPFVGLTFSIGGAAWQGVAKPEIRLDNVHYARPAFYVSTQGSDTNDGRSEMTAFATPQKAIDAAQPGDIIVVMNGTYLPRGAQEGIVNFTKAGTPAAWISLKNYPGHKPRFELTKAWVAIRIWDRKVPGATAPGATAPVAGVAAVPSYLEVRGLHIRGEGDVAKAKYPDKMNMAAPETNGNGISVSWSAEPGQPVPHHLRFADNLVEFCPGAGIGPGGADWVTIENNIVRNNCWTTIYGTSGISLNGGSNFDGTSGGYRMLIRNNITSGNRTFEIWKQIGKVSDGNGIIVDVNQNSRAPEELRFNGRTLIQNNLTFNNGGSGIHAFKSKRVDVINNTVYMNSASPELEWGQMFVQQSQDVRFFNNIVVAPPDQPVNTNGAKGGDQNSRDIFRANNLYFGGGSEPLLGENDKVGDPQFVNPSIDAALANFYLKPGSPALKAGRWEPFSPLLGLNGLPRPLKSNPDLGAYQQQ
ncbi:MAG TPA: right-handed parallel beta-helix repeat-containing protein [Abditibacteriaceae bacterium]|jgi:hypothetical protein